MALVEQLGDGRWYVQRLLPYGTVIYQYIYLYVFNFLLFLTIPVSYIFLSSGISKLDGMATDTSM